MVHLYAAACRYSEMLHHVVDARKCQSNKLRLTDTQHVDKEDGSIRWRKCPFALIVKYNF